MADTPRPLHVIAAEIRADWRGKDGASKVYFGAVPYLQALAHLDKITDKFGEDPGDDIVIYFLSNAKTWRGPVARRIKAELQEMLKSIKS